MTVLIYDVQIFFLNLLKFDKNHTDKDGDANTDTATYI